MSFQNRLQMRTTCQHCSAATLWPPRPPAASLCAHTLTDTYFNLIPTTAYRKTLGDWHPPICPCTPHSPLLHPLPLTPSAAGHCLLSLSFTALLVWGGRAESLHYCLVLPCFPLPCQPGLTPFTDLKSTICMTQQSGSKGERDSARRGMKTRRGERGWRLRTEGRELEREKERHLKGCSTGSPKVSIKQFSPHETFLLFSFFRHGSYWFFHPLLLYIPLISSSQNLLIPHALCVLNFSPDYPLALDPLLCLSILPSITLLLHSSSCYIVAQAFQGLLSAHICEEGGFSHGAAGENWDSLCSLRDAICPCCLRGVLSPLLFPPSIHPTLCPSTPRRSLVLNHPGMCSLSPLPSSFSPCPITNSFLALPSFSSHRPTHSACFPTHPTHLSPISLCF